MSFEVKNKDLLGRIGKLKTKSGDIETPAFMPVINPLSQAITPQRMKDEFGCDIIITNSYIIKKNFGDIIDLKVHELLKYDGVIATDSGAYQILVYGEVDTTQEEIIDFQKKIGSDIAVILDIPTGWDVARKRVEYTVKETLKRATESLPQIKNHDALWVGPVQGGKHLDLVAKSAKEIGKMPFQIHALGSPTEVMERYMFSVLVDMTMTAKVNLPSNRPLHLFGAGHPMMFAMAVAMGCDLFDSAAYILYAKNDRYMTNRGTILLKNLNYLPCACPVCRNIDAQKLKKYPKGVRQRLIAEHNLHVCISEIDTIKQAITEGELWDLVETRARSHAEMMSAFKRLSDYNKDLEKGTPIYKGKGLFYYDYNSLAKPQVYRHIKQLKNNYRAPPHTDTLLLITAPSKTPYNSFQPFSNLKKQLKGIIDKLNICFYAPPYGIIPDNLSETYPLSQFEIATPLDHETIQFTINIILDYIKYTNYQKIVILAGNSLLDKEFVGKLKYIFPKNDHDIKIVQSDHPWSSQTIQSLKSTLIQI